MAMQRSSHLHRSEPGNRQKTMAPFASAAMPYATNSELPSPVQAHLPLHAQDIYREAFNHAFAAHAGDPRREEAAHRIAWAAVKRSYVKVGNSWIARGSSGR
jgi:cation transport regulator